MEDTAQAWDVVLIGGTGFIGSRLAADLVARGKRVMSFGREPKAEHPSPVRVVDAGDREALVQALPEAETVFILTGQNHRSFSQGEELRLLENIVIALNGRPPKKAFYLSSVLVYGERTTPAGEDDPLEPIEPYSQFKAKAEALLRERLDPRIILGVLRLGNVYGSPESRGFIHWVMQAALLHPESSELVLNGDGTQARDSVFIDDVVTALVALSEQCTQSDTVNLATGKSYTLREVVDLASNVVSRAIPFTLNHSSLTEVHTSLVSVDKLTQRYGITLEHDLVSGLRLTADRYRSALLN